ncbi:MAG: glucose-6-phosphate isomerase [Bacteroidales bacterium]
MKNLELNIDNVSPFISKDVLDNYDELTRYHIRQLHQRTGEGANLLGWLDLPSNITDESVREIEEVTSGLNKKIEIMVVVGIGGSYLGSKAVIDALSHSFNICIDSDPSYPKILFAGQNISEDYIGELVEYLEDKSYAITVISKSGTTTEPAIAFRILRNHLEKKYGSEEAGKRIVAITSADRGALRKLTDERGYRSFVIPDDVGGRYSLLTPVGLLPIAQAGFNIKELIAGAKKMEEMTQPGTPFRENPAALYAAARNALYRQSPKTEILASYHPKLVYLAEWWKQLYGESEGKEKKGIFPASVNFTADLHSMGQYIQEGERNLFETVISIEQPYRKVVIPKEEDDGDELNYLAGKRIDEVNKMAELGTMLAHVDGGVPNILVKLPELNEYYLGQLMYFFEKACAISGYLMNVNPFDQPGVEAYKNNMFALLKKPGFEEETKSIFRRIEKSK